MCYTIPTDSYSKGERQNGIQIQFPIVRDGACWKDDSLRYQISSSQYANKKKKIFFSGYLKTGGLNVIFRIILHMYEHGKWQEVTKGQNFHF